MKKCLLVVVAALFVALGADAQTLTKKDVLKKLKFDKTTVMEAKKKDILAPTTGKRSIKRAAIGDIFGTFCASQIAPDKETPECFSVTFEAANETVDGVTYNVKINDFWNEGTTCYGIYNEADGTLRIPNQLIWADVSLEGLGYVEKTKTYGPLEIINIDANDQVSEEDIVLVYDEEDGSFSFDDSKTSAYFIYADGVDEKGEDVGGWTYAYDVRIAPYNGEMSFYTTASKFITTPSSTGSSWGFGEMPVNYQDWGSSVVINGFLGTGSISIGFSGDEAVLEMGQPLSYGGYGQDEGNMCMTGVIQYEEGGQGKIKIDEEGTVTSMKGEIFRDVEYGGRPADVIRFFGVDDEGHITWEEYFCPLTKGQGYWMGGFFADLQVVMYKDGGTGITAPKATTDTKSTTLYDLQGRVVDGSYKGIVISNGKKMVVK